MKSIALHVPTSSHHAGFWTLLRGFFQFEPFRGITSDTARLKVERPSAEKEMIFFREEDELEEYIRSFRE